MYLTPVFVCTRKGGGEVRAGLVGANKSASIAHLPTSRAIGEWVAARRLPIRDTQLFRQYQATSAEAAMPPAKANLGKFAIQEAMNQFAVLSPTRAGVFLFEDHKIARASFLLPDNARKVSTRAYLLFLEQRGWLGSAAEIERRAIQTGRNFSRLWFPPA